MRDNLNGKIIKNRRIILICKLCKKNIIKKECLCYNKNIESLNIIKRFIKHIFNKNQKIIDEIKLLISNNSYVENCKSNKNKDINSLSYIICRNLSQSDCIKLGNGIEKVTNDIILKYTNFNDIKEKNTKGKKEKDHLFCDDNNKIIYYSELKSNINLDTEKSKATYEKCLYNVSYLKNMYPGYEIKWCLLCTRYVNKEDIPKHLKHRYKTIENNLFGINDYFKLLNIGIVFTFRDYVVVLNNIADKMFSE
jgi:hypothetical protein